MFIRRGDRPLARGITRPAVDYDYDNDNDNDYDNDNDNDNDYDDDNEDDIAYSTCERWLLRMEFGQMRRMETLNQFMAYAEAFEKTYADDDWSRLRPYFADDAVYEVQSELFGCSLQGPDAILAGLKKSVNGFDRKFAERTIDVTAPPQVEGAEISLDWTVTYQQEGLTPFVLRGRSRAQLRDGKIIALVDSYDSSVTTDAVAWQQANGVDLDPSYI